MQTVKSKLVARALTRRLSGHVSTSLDCFSAHDRVSVVPHGGGNTHSRMGPGLSPNEHGVGLHEAIGLYATRRTTRRLRPSGAGGCLCLQLMRLVLSQGNS